MHEYEGRMDAAGPEDFLHAYRLLNGPVTFELKGGEAPRLSSYRFGQCRISSIATPAFFLQRRKAGTSSESRQIVVTVLRTARSIHQSATHHVANEGSAILIMDPRSDSTCSCDRYSERTVLHLPRDLLPSSTRRVLDRPLVVPEQATGIPAIFRQTVQAIAGQRDALSGPERIRLQRSLVGLFTDLVASAVPPGDERGQTGLATLRIRAESIIESDLSTLRGVDDLSARLGCSPRHLHNAFAERNTTPARRLWSARLNRAREDILSVGSETTLTEIAYQCGFRAYAHFSRSFKQAFGHSPQACWQQCMAASTHRDQPA